jgi:hypothetical protein
MLRRNAPPDVVRGQYEPDGAHPAIEEAAQARHARILVVVATVVVSVVVSAIV